MVCGSILKYISVLERIGGVEGCSSALSIDSMDFWLSPGASTYSQLVCKQCEWSNL